jgi:hypothetical protein
MPLSGMDLYKTNKQIVPIRITWEQRNDDAGTIIPLRFSPHLLLSLPFYALIYASLVS